MAGGEKPIKTGSVPHVFSGSRTGSFNIPDSLAYAQLANSKPIYGLCSSSVSSHSTGTFLMMSSLTSTTSLSTGIVLHQFDIMDRRFNISKPGEYPVTRPITEGIMNYAVQVESMNKIYLDNRLRH